MTMSYHKVFLIGNLGRDPQLRYTPSGQQVADFSLATSEKWTGQDGQLQERTIWWRITVWGQAAENCNQYLKKGSKVLVEGRMAPDPKTGSPRLWTRQDGTSAASYEVTALTVKFLSSRGSGQASEPEAADTGADGEADQSAGDDGGLPF
jgi:single-strand DNA-binding protein